MLLYDLNDDVTCYIFRNLYVHDRMNMRQVCQRYREIMDTERSLQLKTLILVDYRRVGLPSDDFEVPDGLLTCEFLHRLDAFTTHTIRSESLQKIIARSIHCHEGKRYIPDEPAPQVQITEYYALNGKSTKSCVRTRSKFSQLLNATSNLSSLTIEACYLNWLPISHSLYETLQSIEIDCRCIVQTPIAPFTHLIHVHTVNLYYFHCREGYLKDLLCSLPLLKKLYLQFYCAWQVVPRVTEVLDSATVQRRLTHLRFDYGCPFEDYHALHSALDLYLPQCDFVELKLPLHEMVDVAHIAELYRSQCSAQKMEIESVYLEETYSCIWAVISPIDQRGIEADRRGYRHVVDRDIAVDASISLFRGMLQRMDD
jgi:hypothetical protein